MVRVSLMDGRYLVPELKSSNSETLSAFVQAPTAPAFGKTNVRFIVSMKRSLVRAPRARY